MSANSIDQWKEKIHYWKEKYQCQVFPPVKAEILEELEKQLGGIPADLKTFYMVSNGLFNDWFFIFPIEDPSNIKKTWESISKANKQGETKYLNGDSRLLEEFLIFSDISGGNSAAFNKNDNSIWFEEDSELYQTDLTLAEFIEGMLEEASDL